MFAPSSSMHGVHGIHPGIVRGPTLLHGEIKNFAKRANALADEVLGDAAPVAARPASRERTVIIRDYCSPWYSPFWSPCPVYQPVYVIGGNNRRDNRDNSDTSWVVGIAAAIFGGIALYATGTALNRYQDAERELEDTYQFQDKLSAARSRVDNEAQLQMLEDARCASSLKARICARIRNSAAADLAFRVGAVVGCAVALVGAFATIPALMSAGAIMTLLAGGAMLFKWGYESTNRQMLLDAQALKASVHGLQ